ncbi:MAG: hypothetical protein EZS28_014403 [Streblomastix strix]|uniref:Uncharacterized protein n=1 Tax=Streblomastix strix TaxID=222440 RepID=A0A5J4W5N2_9EUKA|nr:MAG: hypothetical protein EZS28_014403 [Streblomastix strix]
MNELQKQRIEEEKEKVDETIPQKIKCSTKVFEKMIYRVNNQYFNSQNSRRFGFIAAEDEIMNNIPVPGKNFRAITYDEKEGIIRLGWMEAFRWIPTQDKYRITFELDLRDDVEQNTIRIFHETNEGPIVFVNVTKILKLYV